MANNCFYTMKIKGSKKNCYKWLDKMRNHEEENHFWRIFNADPYEEFGTDEEYVMYIDGDCAWSLASCCLEGGYSNKDLFALHTKELNLEMEAYSEECGLEFAEHYLYRNGVCILDECIHYHEVYWDKDIHPTYAEFKKEHPDAPPEDELIKNDYWYSVGGFNAVFNI